MAFFGAVMVTIADAQARRFTGNLAVVGPAYFELLMREFGPVDLRLLAARAGRRAPLRRAGVDERQRAGGGAGDVRRRSVDRTWWRRGCWRGSSPCPLLCVARHRRRRAVRRVGRAVRLRRGRLGVPRPALRGRLGDLLSASIKALLCGLYIPLAAACAGLNARGGARRWARPRPRAWSPPAWAACSIDFWSSPRLPHRARVSGDALEAGHLASPRYAARRAQGLRRPLVVFEDAPVEVPARRRHLRGGPSGSGKSVLCRLAVGLDAAGRGEVALFGAARRPACPSARCCRCARGAVPGAGPGAAGLADAASRTWRWRSRGAATGRGAGGAGAGGPARGLRPSAAAELGPGVQKRAAIARALVLQPRYLLLRRAHHRARSERGAAGERRAGAAARRKGLARWWSRTIIRLLARLADGWCWWQGGRARMFGDRAAFLASR